MRFFWCGFLVLLMASQTAGAELKDPNDPNELLKSKWDSIILVLQNKDIDQKSKETEISEIVSPIFDFPLMAKLALGRKNWPKLTPPQQERFTELFVERLKSSYVEKILLFTDEKVLFKPTEQDKKTVQIPVELISGEKTAAMLYKLRKVDGCWKIYDVEIEGVSILLTYRSQFDDILLNGSVEDLLARLEKPATD
jgi:phospholipid transport system substrate-binding protein